MLKISIPQPCHEDWNKMSPNEQGRHCNSCSKTVVDFTAMSDDEVKHFFISKREEKVCGRFREKQLDQIVIDLPYNIFIMEMPLWKKFLVASLVVFSTTLFSCNTSIDGQLIQNGQPMEQLEKIGDQLKPRSYGMVGMLMVKEETDTIKTLPQTCTTTKGLTVPVITSEEPKLMGDVAMIPDTTKPKKCEPVLMGVPALEPIKKDTAIHLMGKPSIKNASKTGDGDCDKKSYQ